MASVATPEKKKKVTILDHIQTALNTMGAYVKVQTDKDGKFKHTGKGSITGAKAVWKKNPTVTYLPGLRLVGTPADLMKAFALMYPLVQGLQQQIATEGGEAAYIAKFGLDEAKSRDAASQLDYQGFTDSTFAYGSLYGQVVSPAQLYQQEISDRKGSHVSTKKVIVPTVQLIAEMTADLAAVKAIMEPGAAAGAPAKVKGAPRAKKVKAENFHDEVMMKIAEKGFYSIVTMADAGKKGKGVSALAKDAILLFPEAKDGTEKIFITRYKKNEPEKARVRGAIPMVAAQNFYNMFLGAAAGPQAYATFSARPDVAGGMTNVSPRVKKAAVAAPVGAVVPVGVVPVAAPVAAPVGGIRTLIGRPPIRILPRPA